MAVIDQLRAGLSDGPAGNRPAGIEIAQQLEPAAGLPVWPPSYEGRLEIHDRHVDGERRSVIELDSVGSSANRLEEILLALHVAGRYPLPVSDTKVTAGGEQITITTLEMPHRTFDAWLRLSAGPDGLGRFEESELGLELSGAHMRSLDALLETSAHDLLLGAWDSHRKGPNGQLRIPRALTTTLIGFDPIEQAQFAARRDPLNLGDASEAGKDGKRLSEQGLSSIPPQMHVPYGEDRGQARVEGNRGGVSITSARFLGFLSFPALRRLGFSRYDNTDVRALLAALALYSVALRCAEGWELRARCSLLATGPVEFRLVHADGRRETLDVDVTSAQAAFEELVETVAVQDRSVHLDAGAALNDLVEKSIKALSKS